ncbi:MAG: hypothetical protein LBD13_00795 [Spirochaetaceae bacterium]|jgi:hypothetical protein|nr:hypothetical protein [Spirochaetaceae bacterium]
MPCSKPKPVRFIALIPHRDSAAPLEAYRSRLFAAGARGAYSFPAAAPLAAVSRALLPEELKALACSLREANASIRLGAPSSCAYPPFVFWGPELEMAAPGITGGPDLVLWQHWPPVLCAALVPRGREGLFSPPPPPQGAFKAAMVANLIIRPLGQGDADYSFIWKIGSPVWLPSHPRRAAGGCFTPCG